MIKKFEVNKVLKGDTVELLKNIPSNSIDLIFADPPYWMRVSGVLNRVEGSEYDGCDDHWDNQFKDLNDYNNFTKNWLSECRRVLKDNGSIWVIGSMQCIYSIGNVMQEAGFWFINDVVWHKKNPTPNFHGTRLNNSHETLIWATKNSKSKYTFNYKTAKELNTDTVTEAEFASGVRKQLGSVWKIGICQGSERLKDTNGNKLHSTQKPEELLRRIIAISSNINDIVLDPFGGTMTTGAVAKRMGRKYLMLEREEEYIKYGLARIEETKIELGDIEKAVFDIKPIKVTLEEMIKAGFLFENEDFYIKNDKNPKAQLLSNGRLNFNSRIIDIHSCAAIVKGSNSQRLNGFDVWYVLRDQNLKSISTIRDEYRATLNKDNLTESVEKLAFNNSNSDIQLNFKI